MRATAKARLSRFLRDSRGAVAAVYAIALPALIMVGGVAFDYSRMVSMDTELQTAADSAALAGVTQLDGKDGARAKAIAAAQNWVNNWSLMAQSAGKITLTATNVTFYSSAESSTPVTTDAEAKVMEVTIDPRTVVYTLTPVMDAFGPTLQASARAGIGSAICKIPPLMMCTDDTATLTPGKGLQLVAGGGNSWTPGNFGYLEVAGPGANKLEKALGGNIPLNDCTSTEAITTEPGAQVSVTDAINTRFDIFESSLVSYCAASGGKCSPAQNVRKDVSHVSFTAGGNGNGNGNNGNNGNGGGSAGNCGTTGNDPWTLAPAAGQYLPDATTGVQATTPLAMGHPRDICHAKSMSGTCTGGRLGDGAWDRTTYLTTNYPVTADRTALQTAATGLGFGMLASLTRYQMYKAEIAALSTLAPAATKRSVFSSGNGGNAKTYYSYLAPQCAVPATPSTVQLDRRLSAIAVVDCNDYNGKVVSGKATGVKVLKWIEIFFVEPSLDRPRTTKGDIYVEIVREVKFGEGAEATAPVRKDVPYLIR